MLLNKGISSALRDEEWQFYSFTIPLTEMANELFLWVKKLIGVLYKGLFCNDERIRMLA